METGSPREYGVITVRDILSFALPARSTVAAGGAGMGREVTWATRLRATLPAFGHVAGGEIVILDPSVLEMIDENLTLANAIRQLSAFGVSVIATSGKSDDVARAAADAASLPLIELPRDTDLGSLERTAARTIAERRRELQQKGQESGRQLMDMAIAGDSIVQLAEELGMLSGRAVQVESSDGQVLAYYPDLEETLEERQAQSILQPSQLAVYGWLRSVGSSSSAEPPVHGWVDSNGWTRLVAPVTGRHGLLGSVSMLIPTQEERPEDTILLSRAAAASAVTMAQELATHAARREVELNVLDELLDGALRSEIALAQQAERLGHNLDQTFVAIVARPDTQQGSATRSREARTAALEAGVRSFVHGLNQPDVLWRVRNANVEIVVPGTVIRNAPDLPAKLQAALTQSLSNQSATDSVSVGIGRYADGMQGIRRSHQDARQALILGRRLHGSGHTTDYDDLGIYRLILAAESLPELRIFHDESLGTLVEYDRVHNSNLVETLEAWFAANCSPKEASALLQVHRNTVLYRLERIADITGQNLEDPDVRLRLHLALYVRTALGS